MIVPRWNVTGYRLWPLLVTVWAFLYSGSASPAQSRVSPFFAFHTNDIVAFVGAANVVAAQEFGFLETLITLAKPDLNLRFRNLAREGDTGFAQPRDVKFPSLGQQLDQAGATVLFVQFGQSESLDGTNSLSAFVTAYRAFIGRVAQPNRRIVLLSPVPFESSEPPLPDLSRRNQELQKFVAAIGSLATELKIGFLNLSEAEANLPKPQGRLTSNGIHLTPAGHWYYDRLAAIRLGLRVNLAGVDVDPATGAFSRSDLERARQAVLAKNRLWFDYSRPMNWAFLGGDRVEQPSSRDHRDLKVRWFPVEMERFPSLIREAESNINRLARVARNP